MEKNFISNLNLAVQFKATCKRRGILSYNGDFFAGESTLHMLISTDDFNFTAEVTYLFSKPSEGLYRSNPTSFESKKLSFWSRSHIPCYDEPHRNYLSLVVPNLKFPFEKERLAYVPLMTGFVGLMKNFTFSYPLKKEGQIKDFTMKDIIVERVSRIPAEITSESSCYFSDSDMKVDRVVSLHTMSTEEDTWALLQIIIDRREKQRDQRGNHNIRGAAFQIH